MTDDETTLAELRSVVAFVAERRWERFHQPKNLVMALAIEAAELMEHFQWLDADEAAAAMADVDRREAVGEEMADVLCYLLALAEAIDLDLSAAMRAKMVKNRIKYPAPEFRGRYGPNDPRAPESE